MKVNSSCGGRLAVVGAALLFALPAVAQAQQPVASFDQLGTRLRVGDTIYVADGGDERKGRLLELSPSVLVLDAGGAPQEWPANRVQSISWRKPDSLGNGALIGLGVGAGVALAWTAWWCSQEYCESSAYLVTPLLYGGIGAGIGVGIDALVPGKKIPIYHRAVADSHVTLGFSPFVGPKSQGAGLTLGF